MISALMTLDWLRSEKRGGNGAGPGPEGNEEGKLELRGGWLVRGRPKRSIPIHTREKRRSRRYPDGQRAICHPDGLSSFNAQVVDASPGGLRIRTEGALALESWVSIVLRFGGEMGLFFVKTVWRGEREGSHEYGVLFSKIDQNGKGPLGRYLTHLRQQPLSSMS
ncbi:MAG: PilZ domain-containing protein [Candidatus Eremiobacteraeota bacterium]|nr:PilZ domain-containing protein [Candidatus Eremiobacteraeota bacterium]